LVKYSVVIFDSVCNTQQPNQLKYISQAYSEKNLAFLLEIYIIQIPGLHFTCYPEK